jgi:DNA (cytosine-5)-methyltransferase 1
LDGVKGNLKTSDERIESGHQVDLPNVVLDLLPITTASDWKGANRSGGKSASANMLAAKIDLLPTTTTNGNERKGPGYSSAGILQELEIANGILPKEYLDWDHAAQKVSSIPEQKSEKVSLDETITWGKFEPAIRRWENVLGRPAPAPTKPDGRDDAHRLSSEFTEWMMGLPAGWVTGCGLTRNEELKACGNGVVPQQAELALRILLEGISFEPAGGGR